jgi:hypothetical protein
VLGDCSIELLEEDEVADCEQESCRAKCMLTVGKKTFSPARYNPATIAIVDRGYMPPNIILIMLFDFLCLGEHVQRNTKHEKLTFVSTNNTRECPQLIIVLVGKFRSPQSHCHSHVF